MSDSLPARRKTDRQRAEFEQHVLAELKHLREQAKHTNEALEWVLKALKVDEERHEAEATSV